MDAATEGALRRAYRLIKDADTEGARAIIKPLLAAERDNIDAWWLAAHAAVTPLDAQIALGEVLRLNPEHYPARIMLERLKRLHPELVHDGQTPSIARRRRDGGARHRWLWNVVLVCGLVMLSLGALALVSTVLGLTWFHEAVEQVADTIGVDVRPDDSYGSLDIPAAGGARSFTITQEKGVTPGDVMVGALLPGEAHVWTFNGRAGQDVMAMVQFTVAGDASHVIELHNAAGRKLAQGVGQGSDSGTVTLVHTLAGSGAYRLVILGQPDGPRGSYALGLEVG